MTALIKPTVAAPRSPRPVRPPAPAPQPRPQGLQLLAVIRNTLIGVLAVGVLALAAGHWWTLGVLIY